MIHHTVTAAIVGKAQASPGRGENPGGPAAFARFASSPWCGISTSFHTSGTIVTDSTDEPKKMARNTAPVRPGRFSANASARPSTTNTGVDISTKQKVLRTE